MTGDNREKKREKELSEFTVQLFPANIQKLVSHTHYCLGSANRAQNVLSIHSRSVCMCRFPVLPIHDPVHRQNVRTPRERCSSREPQQYYTWGFLLSETASSQQTGMAGPNLWTSTTTNRDKYLTCAVEPMYPSLHCKLTSGQTAVLDEQSCI